MSRYQFRTERKTYVQEVPDHETARKAAALMVLANGGGSVTIFELGTRNPEELAFPAYEVRHGLGIVGTGEIVVARRGEIVARYQNADLQTYL